MVADVLAVDDEPLILKSLERFFSRSDVGFRGVTSALAALELLAERRPDVLVTDYRMPGMDGLALAWRVRVTWPDLRIIVASAEADWVREQAPVGVSVLSKPYDLDLLLRLIVATQ